MASNKIYGDGSIMNILNQREKLSPSQVLQSLWVPTSSPVFNGYTQNFAEENGDKDLDGCLNNQPGKKRRLTIDQVQFLEKNFDVENKLEQERKTELAIELGLQPRQVAIWFQNRRARFKNKELEKDYDLLKTRFNTLKDDYDSVFMENEKLKKILLLKDRLLLKEMKPKSEANDPTNSQKTISNEESGNENNASMAVCKMSSAKSETFYSDSSNYTFANQSPLLGHPDLLHLIEPENSDFSPDEKDNLICKNLLPTMYFPNKFEDGVYHDNDLSVNSSDFEFPAEDHQPFWLLPY